MALFDEIDITSGTLADIERRAHDVAVLLNMDVTVEFRQVALASIRSGECPVGSAVLSIGAPRKSPRVIAIAEQDGIGIRRVSLVCLSVNTQDAVAGEEFLAALNMATAKVSGELDVSFQR
jgi:hypothetical protein